MNDHPEPPEVRIMSPGLLSLFSASVDFLLAEKEKSIAKF
jgi:hypothetical protein